MMKIGRYRVTIVIQDHRLGCPPYSSNSATQITGLPSATPLMVIVVPALHRAGNPFNGRPPLLPDTKFQVLFRRVSEHCRMAKVILYTWQVALTCLQVILKCITTGTIGTLATAEGQLAVQLHQLPKCKACLGLQRAGVGGLEFWLGRE